MKRHPLTVVRASIDHKQAAYARLVAKAHADLNLGTPAARPEKISLWESGRVVPDLGAQFAIAHICITQAATPRYSCAPGPPTKRLPP